MRHSYPKKKKNHSSFIWNSNSVTRPISGNLNSGARQTWVCLSALTDHVTMAVSASDFCGMDFQAPMQAGPGSGQRRAAGREKPVFLDSFPAAAAFPPGSQLLLPMDPELPRHMSWFLQPRSVCPRIAIIKAIHHTLVGLGFCHSAYYFWDSSMLCLSGVHSFSTPSFIEIQLTYNIV